MRGTDCLLPARVRAMLSCPLPLRIGAPSYVLHAPYVPAVRYSAQHCDAVALLLFETGERGEYLPSPAEIHEIGHILAGEGVSLHVHLPTDAHCATASQAHTLCQHIDRALDCVAPLAPELYVLHLDVPCASAAWQSAPSLQQQAQAEYFVHNLRARLAPEQICVENLEGYAPHFWDALIAQQGLAHCLDAGHVWKDGGKPETCFAAWQQNCPLIHIHGNTQQGGRLRDHQSLACLPPSQLDAFLFPLWGSAYAGILVLEVFTQADLATSQAALCASYQRWQRSTTLCP